MACGTTRPISAPVPVQARAVRNDLHWFRASAEYRGLTREIYRDATEHLAGLTEGMPAGQWAVILDADETVLDNSLNERRLADRGLTYSDSGWAVWVREGVATAIPGAVEFTAAVQARGGRVVIVSNRADSLCDATRANLTRVGVRADLVLCQTGPGDKNPRFALVEHGGAAPGIPPLTVVEWIGDNIQDFPGLTQSVRDTPVGYVEFGHRYYLLPNPMYGSWEKVLEPR